MAIHFQRVLIIGTDYSPLKALIDLLENQRFQVRVLCGGNAPLDVLFNERIDLIIIDISLPDQQQDFSLCRRIKSFPQFRRIPIIFLSPLNDPEQKAIAFRAGGVDCITKPFYQGELLARINYHLKAAERYRLDQQQLICEWKNALAEREQIFETIPDLLCILSSEGRFIKLSKSWEHQLGWSRVELYERTLAEVIHPEDRDHATAALLKSNPNQPEEQAARLICRCQNKSGTWLWFEWTRSVGSEGTVCAFARDVTRKQEIEMELKLAANIYQNAIEGIIVTDSNGTILSVNPAFTTITGYTAEEVLGKTPKILKSNHHNQEFYHQLWKDLEQRGWWQGEIWNRRKNGQVFLEWQTITAITDNSNQTLRYVSMFSDITEWHDQNERIRHLAYYDPLTGLPNRQLLMDRLEYALSIAQRDDRLLAVLFIDIDHFKVVNDTLGHDQGDLLLQKVADCLKRWLRHSDTVARLGGDEFVILLDGINNTEYVGQIVEKVFHAITRSFSLKGYEINVSASMGIAIYPHDGMTAVELMKNADTAMYAAKAQGRHNYCFFDPSMKASAQRRLELETALRKALEHQEFELHYQPKINFDNNRICGVEALIRWRRPEIGLVPPGQFIPVSEETGLIIELGNWVLDEACQQILRWRQKGFFSIPIAINVSPIQLQKYDIAAQVINAIRRYQIDPTDLQIELTESSVMQDPKHAITVLSRLREQGVPIAIDDFGTGYSSLAYLKRLPIDVIKIDRSFVTDADSNPEDVEIIRTIIALAHSLHLSVVAEGIENRAQVEVLKKCGCTIGQGYWFARPMPVLEFERWFIEHTNHTNKESSLLPNE